MKDTLCKIALAVSIAILTWQGVLALCRVNGVCAPLHGWSSVFGF